MNTQCTSNASLFVPFVLASPLFLTAPFRIWWRPYYHDDALYSRSCFCVTRSTLKLACQSSSYNWSSLYFRHFTVSPPFVRSARKLLRGARVAVTLLVAISSSCGHQFSTHDTVKTCRQWTCPCEIWNWSTSHPCYSCNLHALHIVSEEVVEAKWMTDASTRLLEERFSLQCTRNPVHGCRENAHLIELCNLMVQESNAVNQLSSTLFQLMRTQRHSKVFFELIKLESAFLAALVCECASERPKKK